MKNVSRCAPIAQNNNPPAPIAPVSDSAATVAALARGWRQWASAEGT